MSSKNLKNAGTTIAEFVTVGGRGDQTAAAYMLISVLGFSMIPVVVALGGRESPLMFSAVLRLGAVLGYAGFLFLFYRRLLFRKAVWREVFRAIWASPLQLGGRTVYTFVPFLLATVTYFDYAFFAVAVHSIDVSVATVFYEAWPILLIALTGYLFNRERRYERTGWEVFAFSILGFVGFVFVAASEAGGLLIGAEGRELTRLGSGFGFLAIALVLAPLSAFGLRWGVDLGRRLEGVTGLEREYLSFFAVVMVNFLGNLAALPFIVVASTVVLGESGLGWYHVVYGLLGGLVALTLANVAWRKVNLVTIRLGVNAMSYLTPLFGLFWIYLLSDFRPARMDYLVIGATVVLTSNLLINFAAEIRSGFGVVFGRVRDGGLS